MSLGDFRPLSAEEATRALADRVIDLQGKMDRGQIQILDHSQWYSRTGELDADSLLRALIDAEQSARTRGYSGLRLTGNVSFLNTAEGWREFERYESRVTQTFAGRRLIGLCSYDLTRSDGVTAIDILRNHQFALLRRTGAWEVLDAAGTNAAQDELQRSNSEPEDRAQERIRSLERALQDRDLAARGKDEFLAMLGHEVRNVLAPMATALQLMRLRGTESREHEILVRQLALLTRLVDDLLDVSRITRGHFELRKRPIEFSQMVIRAIELASPLIEQRQQSLDVQVPPDGLLVEVDPERMARVIGNLLTNAAKYSDPRKHIQILAHRSERKVRCIVKDEGIGIASEMLQGVFDAFVQQPHTLNRARGGLGLGLTIVRNLVLQHGGSVLAKSEGLGRGSEFIVELPAFERAEGSATPGPTCGDPQVEKGVGETPP